MDDLEVAAQLIDSAMAEVELAVCDICMGLGTLTKGLDAICPKCGGRGEVVKDV